MMQHINIVRAQICVYVPSKVLIVQVFKWMIVTVTGANLIQAFGQTAGEDFADSSERLHQLKQVKSPQSERIVASTSCLLPPPNNYAPEARTPPGT